MRHQDWPERLARYVKARRSMPFAWGSNDCVTFAADWIVEATGDDPIADLRGWTSATEAARKLSEMEGMREAVRGVLGDPMSAAMAWRGDVVLLEIDGRQSLGVCCGEYAAAPGEGGALLVPMFGRDPGQGPVTKALCAWRVG